MYDLTSTPNLKPFRQYNANDVINLFAHVSGSVNRGTVVKVVSGAMTGHPNEYQFAADSNAPSRVTSLRAVNPWKVNTCTSGDTPLGITLYDVREVNAYGKKYIFEPRYETSEQQVVVSGQSVPVLTQGIVEINGFSGTPGPGSGAIVSTVADGRILVSNSIAKFGAGRVGTFLTTSGTDGYALLKVEL